MSHQPDKGKTASENTRRGPGLANTMVTLAIWRGSLVTTVWDFLRIQIRKRIWKHYTYIAGDIQISL
jgi:hypothetical protein